MNQLRDGGIGKEIPRVYAKAGAAVAIADLNLHGARATAEEIKALGEVDILASNAGFETGNPIEEYPFADWKKMLAIHRECFPRKAMLEESPSQ